ncbi:MAG: hypothetical protein KatS3mg118_2580 [Paracoccaceae bacterium]|nr:MAG: hypothetical protein KatS3mg118_2580 [Paracoccaceae bacterium]
MTIMPKRSFPSPGGPEAQRCIQPLPAGILAGAKRAFTTRRVALDLAAGIERNAAPRAGDVVLAEVETLGQHRWLEDIHGRRVTLNEGDRILVAYGDRYAPDQFEAHVPATSGPCALVAGGGVAAEVLRRSARVRDATRILPLGILVDATGRRLNLRDFAMKPAPGGGLPSAAARVIAVVGSSMNAGKTTAISAMVRGALRSGQKVAVIKVTGTGSGGDLWAQRDAGAGLALDFTDAGHASTHRLTDAQRLEIFRTLLRRCRQEPGIGTIFVEVADGLLFGESARLVLSGAFRGEVDALVLAAADAMGALYGEGWLIGHGLAPLALTGAFTASPIAADEVRAHARTPVLAHGELADGALAADRHPGRPPMGRVA